MDLTSEPLSPFFFVKDPLPPPLWRLDFALGDTAAVFTPSPRPPPFLPLRSKPFSLGDGKVQFAAAGREEENALQTKLSRPTTSFFTPVLYGPVVVTLSREGKSDPDLRNPACMTRIAPEPRSVLQKSCWHWRAFGRGRENGVFRFLPL